MSNDSTLPQAPPLGGFLRGWQVLEELGPAVALTGSLGAGAGGAVYVQRFRVRRAANGEVGELRILSWPHASAQATSEVLGAVQRLRATERQLLAAQAQPSAQPPHLEKWLDGWEDEYTALDVFAVARGETLAQFARSHPPLAPADGRTLLLGALEVLGTLHSAGLSVPKLTAAHIWLGADGHVGLRDLVSAGLESLGADEAEGKERQTAVRRDLSALAKAVGPAVRKATSLGQVLARLEAGELHSLAATRAALLESSVAAAPTPVLPQPAERQRPQAGGRYPVALLFWVLLIAALGVALALYWPTLRTAALNHPVLAKYVVQVWPSAQSGGAAQPKSGADAAAEAPQPDGLTKIEPEDAQPDTPQVMVTASALNLRPTPDTGGAAIGQLGARQIVQVTARRNGWLKVEAGELHGWISEDYTLPVLPAAELNKLRAALQARSAVTLARGVYLLDTPLELNWDTHLKGQGLEATFLIGRQKDDVGHAPDGGAALVAREVAVKLSDLSVIWQARQPGQAMRVERGSVQAENVAFVGGVARSADRKVGSGLWLRSGAQARLTGCRFERNAYGLSVTGGSMAWVQKSRLGDNLHAGVYWSGQATGRLEGSRVDSNGGVGVLVTGTARPDIANNILENNGESAIEVLEAAAPTITGNTLSKLGQRGILLGGQSRAAVRANILSAATEAGLLYIGRAAGVAESNQIMGGLVGIRVQEAAAPELRANKVSDVANEGIRYGGSAGGSAVGNVVSGAGGSGLLVGGTASPLLEGNTVRGGRLHGIEYDDVSTGRASRNTAEANAAHGIRVGGKSTPILSGNAALRNGGYGVAWTNNAGGSAERNLCEGNRKGPALAVTAAQPNIDADPCVVQARDAVTERGATPPTSAATDTAPSNTAPSNTAPAQSVP